jgi:hypothetical protein
MNKTTANIAANPHRLDPKAVECFWQVGLAHFGGLFWPTPWNVEVSRVVFGSAGA